MIDHHVDRPGVYVQQCTQLTGPNRPKGSAPPAMHSNHPHQRQAQPTAHTTRKPEPDPRADQSDIENDAPRSRGTRQRSRGAERADQDVTRGWLRQPGGHGGGTTPDPIPNSDVKTTSAHDTAPQGAGKSVAARSSEPTRNTPAKPTHPYDKAVAPTRRRSQCVQR